MSRAVPMVALLCIACLAAPSAAQVQVIAGWEEHIFPSYVLSTATQKADGEPAAPDCLGDRYGLFGAVVTASADDEPVRVVVECDSLMEPSEFSGRLPKAGTVYRVLPRIRYRFERLGDNRQATPATVTFRVTQGDAPPQVMTSVITVRSVNDCPWLIQEGDNVINMNQNFAAYVNEQHPFVDKLLREALDIGIVSRFTGYQDGDEASVIRQVYALWDLMASRDVRYSSITASAAESGQTRSQHVRLLEETINNTQANCVDGSVLFASLLRKIGIHCALVVTSDHCYIAFWGDQQRQNLYGLETTLVDQEIEAPEVPGWLEQVVDESTREYPSWGSFLAALQSGTAQVTEGLQQPEDPLQFMLIDIAAARRAGILPIPFSGREEFVAFDFLSDDEDGEADDMDSDDEDEGDDDSGYDDDDDDEYEYEDEDE